MRGKSSLFLYSVLFSELLYINTAFAKIKIISKEFDYKSELRDVNSNKKVFFGSFVERGIYLVKSNLNLNGISSNYESVELFINLPESYRLIAGSLEINGDIFGFRKKGNLYIINLPREALKERQLILSFKVFIPEKTLLKPIYYALVVKKGSKATVLVNNEDLKKSISYILNNKENIVRNVIGKVGLIYPEKDEVVATSSIDIKVGIPDKANYRLLLNGEEVSKDFLAEKSIDKASRTIYLKYIAVPLKKGKNILELYINGELKEKRTIFLSGTVSDFRISVEPKHPVADGKTPVYVIVELVDENGKPVKAGGYINVIVDKGDIYDYYRNEYIVSTNEPFRVPVKGGKAIIKLSPSSETEERRIKVIVGKREKEIKIRFYPEKRSWIVVGVLDSVLGFSSKKKGNGYLPNMPYRHNQGDPQFEGEAKFFAKGTYKDFTITLRYGTRKPEQVLLQQNIPSTQENRFYPIYGDSSEQFFEAKSKSHLFLKIEKDLSYFLYGDYNTDLGRDLEFNKYTRTLNGALINLEKEKSFKVKAFISDTKQEIVQEEFKGRGVSGPYFFKNPPLEFSEKVWIEIRDRYNPQIILNRRELKRFVDYEIDYDNGFIILNEPAPEFDDEFNPIYIVVRYETESLRKKKYKYGVRAEKQFGNWRIGAIGVKEESTIKDKSLAGVDIKYDDQEKGIKFLAEYSVSDGYEIETLDDTDGSAYNVELEYNKNKFYVRSYYRRVKDGYQNPSSSVAQYGYETTGLEIKKDWDKGTLTFDATLEDREDFNRKNVGVLYRHNVSNKLSLEIGGRYVEEERNDVSNDASQVILGFSWKPTNRLTLSLRREQSLSGKNDNIYYPTRTIGSLNYKINNNLSFAFQGEYQERESKDKVLATAGLQAYLGENTTAFAKYSLDGVASGWRNKAHFGLNRTFRITENLHFDIGAETVQYINKSSGSYTSFRIRGVYLQAKNYKVSGEFQVKLANKNEYLIRAGGAFKITNNFYGFIRERFFENGYKENDLLLGFAYRPLFSNKLNFISKLRWKITDRLDERNKFIFSLHANYEPTKRLMLMGQIGAKYIDVKDVGSSFTDLIRGRVIYYMNKWFDVGIHGGLMRNHNTDTKFVVYGGELGLTAFKGIRFGLGYNFAGFYDDDFDGADYWAKGFYVRLSFKFDEDLFKYISRIATGEK